MAIGGTTAAQPVQTFRAGRNAEAEPHEAARAERVTVSVRNRVTMRRFLAPMARRVPISRQLRAGSGTGHPAGVVIP